MVDTTSMIALSAAVVVGLTGLGSAIGQAMAASAAAGATAENEKMFGKMIVFAALPESQAIYGFVIAVILLFVFAATAVP